MANAKNVIPFRSRLRPTCPAPGAGTPEFLQATLDARVFLAACQAGWDARILNRLSKQLSPLAVEIVLWERDALIARKLNLKDITPF